MKYIICPILRLLLILLIIFIYVCVQIIYVFWHLKPDKNLLNELVGQRYYCKTHRSDLNNNWFQHRTMYKVHVTPKSLFQFILWEIKYSRNKEILEITEKEEELYKEFCKYNKP